MAEGFALCYLSLYIGLCGGICGVLVDLDHFPLFGDPGRAGHIPAGVIAGIVFGGTFALLGGLLVRTLLGG